MSDITLSAAVRSNLLSLQNTASLLDTTQTALATGNKVNSALDNPTSYFTASALNSRASDLGNLLDSVSNAIQTIQAANDGITSITKLVESAQATANQAQQLSATVDSTSGAVTESDAVVATSNTTSLTVAAAVPEADVHETSGNTTSLVIHSAVTENDATAPTSDLSAVTIHSAVTENDATTATADLTSVTATGGIITVNGQNVTVTAGDDHDAILADLQGSATAGGYTVADNGDGTLQITSNGGANLTFGGDATTLGQLGVNTTPIVGTPPVAGTTGNVTINGQTVALANNDTVTQIFANLQAAATAAGSGANAFSVANNAGTITITGTGGNDLNISGDAAALGAIGLSTTTVTGTPPVAGTAGNVTVNGQTVTLANNDDATAILNKFQAQAALATGANAFSVSSASGVLTITGTGGNDLAIGGDSQTLTALGLTTQSQTGTTPVAGTAGNVTINGQTVALVAGDTSSSILTKLQNAAGASGSGVNAFTVSNASGVFSITGTGGNDVTISGDAAALGALGLSAATTNGTAANAGTTTQIANPARSALISQYNGLLDQIDQLTADANYNGNNLLAGSSTQLKVVFNETGTSNLTISGKDASAAGLGLTALTSTAFDTNDSITSILSTLKSATDTLRSDASSFGSNLSIVQTRQDFTKSIINTLQTGASNLTLADSNEEAADLLALQTRQSLSTKALSLASQSDQNVLRLLQ